MTVLLKHELARFTGPRRQSRKEQDDFEEKNDKKRRKKRKNDRKIKRSKQSKHSSGASGRKKDSTSNPREKKGSKEAPDEKPDKPIVELDSNNKLRPNSMIVIGDGEFQVDVLIGSGGFGDVYLVKDKDGNKYALKTEYNRAGPASRIKSEVKCYDAIRKAKKADPTSCTRLLDFHGGGSLPNLKFFIMTLVGPSLEDLLISCEISVSTAVRIAIQCFEGIMDLHSVGYVHRDIKLANYVVGLTNRRMIYLVDMGMVCAVLTKDDKMPASSKYEFIGTLLYAPRTSHLGLVQTRKDDLESWIYSCVELFAPNKLPWTRERDRQKVSDMKTEFFKNPGRDPLFQLLPRGFDDIVKKISVMDTLEAPDYKGVRELLDKIAKEEEVDFEEPFEWEQQNQVAEKMKELEKNADKCEKERNLEKNVEKEKNAEKEKNEEKKAEKEMNVEVEKKPDETPKPAGPEGKGEGSPETENVTNLPPIDELAAIEKAEKE
ncbi:hypothetical protein L596_019627 [Steinernema carpocapsae]|uniref:non-specific serine/threonine protein kinase n=1 Tax=Steinernema carpocapsae TaxID=34508 RepID=A0A4U5MRA1_STECR|nr:hypothetical protein L596_019627 [Steinernema carpocapsae]